MNELPAAGQRQLLEIVRQRDAADASDLRFIAGVAPRVDDWVARGELRADLIEGLGVVRIELPPLRQRTEDIALLATHFLKEACRRNGIPAKAFSRSALSLLGALPWPGNTAELRLLAERLAVVVTRGVVLLEDVLANVRLEGAEALGGRSGTLREARERFERDYVATILQQHRGRMGDAAKELGIERTNLYRKIKQLNIRWTTGAE
jgi:two-component system nitrogen regulation response regulator NtrX